MLTIDADDPTPLHAQLERSIRVAIATGRLPMGGKLPTVRQLAVSLRVNANTVARVYAELERAGVLETRRGVGSFVREVATLASTAVERESGLRASGEKFLADAARLGFTADEAVRHLARRVAPVDAPRTDSPDQKNCHSGANTNKRT